MNDLLSLMHNPTRILYVYLAVWTLSALAHTMPAPDGKSSKGYQWFSNLLQFLLANFSRLRSISEKAAPSLPEGLIPLNLPRPIEAQVSRKE